MVQAGSDRGQDAYGPGPEKGSRVMCTAAVPDQSRRLQTGECNSAYCQCKLRSGTLEKVEDVEFERKKTRVGHVCITGR